MYSSQSCHVHSFILERMEVSLPLISVVERCSFWLFPLLTQKLLSNSENVAGDKLLTIASS